MTGGPDRYEIADMILQADQVSIRWEDVEARYVPCDQPTPTPIRGACPDDSRYSVYRGRHSHLVRYETPHRRLVVKLPPEPVEEER